MTLGVIALNCTLKRSPEKSSTDRILQEVLGAFGEFGARGEIVRVADLDIKPGVSSDEGKGDDWPALRKRALAADILVIGTPIWLGQPSSIAKRVLERMDAFIGEKDDRCRMPSYGKLGLVAVVGNEDGAHHCGAELFQALNEVGFTVPAHGQTYWVGEALGAVDYKNHKKTPKATDYMTRLMVANAVHLAERLKGSNYPGLKEPARAA
jgi:multimeric flavodoxin WrbA